MWSTLDGRLYRLITRYHWHVIMTVGFIILLFTVYRSTSSADPNQPPPIFYRNNPLPVLASPYHVGQVALTLAVSRCNQAPIAITLAFTRSLAPTAGGKAVPVASAIAEFQTGCIDTTSQADVLPTTIAPGSYTLKAVGTYSYQNRTYIVSFESQPFDVLP